MERADCEEATIPICIKAGPENRMETTGDTHHSALLSMDKSTWVGTFRKRILRKGES